MRPHFLILATLTLDVGYGGQRGRWSDAFVERVFPAAERTRVLDRGADF